MARRHSDSRFAAKNEAAPGTLSGGDRLSANDDAHLTCSTGKNENAKRKPSHLIRHASESDFEGIMEIENSCFPGQLAYTRRQMRHLIFKANSETFVEESDGRITGYVTAVFRVNSQVAGIETIGVSPDFRGMGTGKKLLEAAERAMAERGAAFSRLEVSSGNEAAISMYRRAGYGVEREIPDYYVNLHHGTRAALRMQKKLRKANLADGMPLPDKY